MRDRCREIAEIPLETLVAQLRESSEASARLYGGTTYYAEELALFKAAARSQSLFLDSAPPELNTPPTAEGNEHQVWFREEKRLRFLMLDRRAWALGGLAIAKWTGIPHGRGTSGRAD